MSSPNDSNGQSQGGGELREWACFSPDQPLVPPGLGRRLRGKLYNGKVPNGSSVRTQPVARIEDSLTVSFLDGVSITLGAPHEEYRTAVDTMNLRAGRPAIDWSNPFRAVADPPAPAADLEIAIQEVRRDVAAARHRANQPPPASPRRSLASIVMGWLHLPSKQGKAKKRKATLPARGATANPKSTKKV